ncbi:MAG: hypothetical protein JEZ02_21985, partial [Desulfatibacillum sp.]|nr:hypothetical protein [Desulfatibacillum sp.]
SAKMESSWTGIMEGLKAYWKEFERLVMGSGAFQVLKSTLSEIRDYIGEMYNDGRLAVWAAKTGAAIGNSIATVVKVLGYIPAAWYSVKKAVSLATAGVAAFGKAILVIAEKAYDHIYGRFGKFAEFFGLDWFSGMVDKGGKAIQEAAQFMDEFGEAQIDGAIEAGKQAEKWMDIGVQVEGFTDGLRKGIDAAADDIAKSGDQAASKMGQANDALAQSVQGASDRMIKAILKTAQADLTAVNKRLSAYQTFYSQVTAMSERAKEQQATHIKELMVLEKARAAANAQTSALVQGLSETSMDPREKYESRRSALNQQYAAALRLSGQEQVEALQAYQNAVAALAQEFSTGVTQSTVSFGQVTEQTVISSKNVITDAVSDIERAGAILDRTFRDMESAKARQIQADQAWAESLATTASEAASEIEYLSSLAASLAAQIEAMETEIEIQGRDEVSPVVAQIQAELDSLHDKTVTITTIHKDVYTGKASTPDPNSVMGSYAGGTRFVPETGPYMLHKGEEVRTKNQTQARAQGGNVTIGDITINVPRGAAAQTPEDWRSITRNIIVPELQRLGK